MALVGLQVDLGRFSSDYMNTGFWAGQVVSTVKCSFSKAIGKKYQKGPLSLSVAVCQSCFLGKEVAG